MSIGSTKRPLPVLVPSPGAKTERTEFGFTRTACGCESCSVNCRFIPGMLTPPDLERLLSLAAVGTNDPNAILDWAKEHLRASPGGVVGASDGQGGVTTVRVHTLVPARQADGMACHWLKDGRCEVHGVSPYGCAFFDSHMTDDAGSVRSLAGLRAILTDWIKAGLYSQLWVMLDSLGLRAPGPKESREKMKAAIGSYYPRHSQASAV